MRARILGTRRSLAAGSVTGRESARRPDSLTATPPLGGRLLPACVARATALERGSDACPRRGRVGRRRGTTPGHGRRRPGRGRQQGAGRVGRVPRAGGGGGPRAALPAPRLARPRDLRPPRVLA